MKKSMRISKFFVFILIMMLFEPNIAVKYDFYNIVFILGGIISFIYITIKCLFDSNAKLFNITVIVIIYRILCILLTFINKGDILKVGYNSMTIVALFLYAEYFFRKNNINEFIRYLNRIITAYLLINFILYMRFPLGLYSGREGIHFLGIRTRFTEYACIGLLLGFISYEIKIIDKKRLFFQIIIVLCNIFVPRVATAIVGLGILLFTYLLVTKAVNKYEILFWIGLALTIVVVFLRIQNIFEFLIVDILGKDLTMTGRTYIWDASYKYIFDRFLFIGHGMPLDGNFVFWRVQLWQAHNQLLQVLFETGIIGSVLFYIPIIMALKNIEKSMCNKKIKALIASMFFTFMIMMITEIYGYYIPTYVLIIMGYYIDKVSIERQEKNEEN